MKDWTSIWRTEVYRAGRCIDRGQPRRNLRTTAADWRSGLTHQARILGGDIIVGSAATGTATTAATATTVTLDGVSAPGSTTAYAGKMIVMGAAYGVITTNTNAAPPVLTIDGWNDPTAPGAMVTTPAAGRWVMLPGNAPAWYVCLSTDATAPSAADTSLASEITTGGLSRKRSTTTTYTLGNTSYTLQVVFSATASFTVNKGALCNAATATAGGAMPFESAEPSPPAVVSGDQLTQNITMNI